MRKLLVVVLAVFLMVMAGSVAASDHNAKMTVIHGIPGVTVDVYANGQLAVPGFAPGTVVNQADAPAGSYDVALTLPGAPLEDAILSATITLEAGKNYSLVAHLTEGGSPTVSFFTNDVSPTDQSRVIVRHLAAAPAVDALFFPGTADELRVGPLANGEEFVGELDAGPYAAGLAPAGTSNVIYGPFSQSTQPGYAYIAYALGSLGDGTFYMYLQPIYVGMGTN